MNQKYGYAKCKDTVSATVELRDMKQLFSEKYEMWQSFWCTDYNVGLVMSWSYDKPDVQLEKSKYFGVEKHKIVTWKIKQIRM
jgi:hypothetical protein